MAIQPDSRLVAACAERDLENREVWTRAVGNGELPFVPGNDLVLLRSGERRGVLLFLLFRLRQRHVRFDGAGPDGRFRELVLNRPAFAKAAVVEIELEPPLAVEQLIGVPARDRARERVLDRRSIRRML